MFNTFLIVDDVICSTSCYEFKYYLAIRVHHHCCGIHLSIPWLLMLLIISFTYIWEGYCAERILFCLEMLKTTLLPGFVVFCLTWNVVPASSFLDLMHELRLMHIVIKGHYWWRVIVFLCTPKICYGLIVLEVPLNMQGWACGEQQLLSSLVGGDARVIRLYRRYGACTAVVHSFFRSCAIMILFFINECNNVIKWFHESNYFSKGMQRVYHRRPNFRL